MPERVLIVALAETNRVIGQGKDLPWHLPDDLRRFKRLTRGYPLLMGRTTFESIVHQFGAPLPGRLNLVLSSEATYPDYPEVEVVRSLDEAFERVADAPRLFIGGGGTLYAQLLEQADRLELTLVEGDHEGDAFFPPYEHLLGTTFVQTAEDHRDGFRFVTYRRRMSSDSSDSSDE